MSQSKIIAIASDHAGFALKELLKSEITGLGYEPLDLGTDNGDVSVDYPDYADRLAAALREGEAEYGVAICGSGIGISIALNRHRHIRAALCGNGLAARLARQHNNANVLVLGARLIGEEMAKNCLQEFLCAAFAGGRHVKRVEKLG